MDDFKIDLFIQEYKKDFPNYTNLSKGECDDLRKSIASKYNIGEADKTIDFLNKLFKNQTYIEAHNAMEDFSLNYLINDLKIKVSSKIFINWYHFDNIDKLDLVDLNKYFDDIWFASSDDIDLFDESLDWIISIKHDGSIYKSTP